MHKLKQFLFRVICFIIEYLVLMIFFSSKRVILLSMSVELYISLIYIFVNFDSSKNFVGRPTRTDQYYLFECSYILFYCILLAVFGDRTRMDLSV